MATKKTLEKAGTKRAKDASQAPRASGSRKNKNVVISMQAQERYYAIVEVPADVTEEELEWIASFIVENGPYESEREPSLIDHEVEDLPEGDKSESFCSAVRTKGRIRVVEKS
jgi:hypothetical protein